MRSWMIGLVVGIIAVSLLPMPLLGWLIPVWLLLAAMGFRYCRPWAALGCGIFLGFSGGTLYGYAVLDSRVSPACEAMPLLLEGVIVSLPRRSQTRDGGRRQRFEFRPDRIEPRHCEGPRRLLLSYYGELTLRPGEHWRFSATLKKPWGLANPGSFNMQSWYAQSGVDGTGNVGEKQAVLLLSGTGSGLNYHAVRLRVSERLRQLEMDESVRAILQALTIADKSGIDSQLWALFQSYGINHLLVISGLHISITAGAGYFFGGVLAKLMSAVGFIRCAGLLPAAMAFGFAFAYAALAGFALATVRALCMLACFVIASLFNRSSWSANNLLMAAVAVLLGNPLAAVGSGFWLSFVAVACLLWLSAWRTGARLPLRLLHTHVYMALAMVPLGAWWFGGVSQVAVLANLILVPLVGLYIVPFALLGVVSYLLAIPIDHLFWTIAAFPLEQILPHALRFAEHQQEFLYTTMSAPPGAVLLALAALALLPLPLPRGIKPLLAVLLLPVLLSPGQKSGEDNIFARLTVLDVGQGTAVVLQSGQHALVYDTGGGNPQGSNMANRVILPYLRSQGVTHLDTLVISHGDNDHSSGAGTMMMSIPVQQLIVGGDAPVVHGGQVCRAGKAWRWPSGVRFQILSPGQAQGLSSNNSSCVLQIHAGGLRFLLPGDIDSRREKELLRYWRGQLRSDFLLVAHHGSLTSSSYTWLKTVQPGYAVFSSGYLNQFGHPHPEIRERYRGLGKQAFTTAIDGAVEILMPGDGTGLATTYRSLGGPYWM